MPADPVDQLRALGTAFDELVPPVTMNDLSGRPNGTSRGRLAVRVFAAAAAVVTLVAVGAIVLNRRADAPDRSPVESAQIAVDLFVHRDPSNILVATPDARSLTAEQMEGYNVVAADAAYSLPDGALAYQPIGETAIWVRAADGSTTEVITPPEGTHLRLYDAGTALGKPVIVYATEGDDEMATVTLHVVNADGTDDRTLGDIGFWEGWASYARLGGDVVTTEEFTVTQGFVMRFDLATGDATDVNNLTLTYPADSAEGKVSARVDGNDLVVQRLSGGEARIALPFDVGSVVALEPAADMVIINRSDAPAMVVRDIWSEQPDFAPVPFAGTASFIESPPAAVADEEIAAALATWSESGPSSYHLTVATTHPLGLITVECEFHVDGSNSALIRGPIRSTATEAPSQMPDLRACSTQPSTVEGLLELILQHRSEGHDVPATFDQRGVPTHFGLDVDLAAADGSTAVEATVSEPLVLPTVTLSAGDYLECGPAGGAWVNASVTSELVGLTARIVVDDRVIASSQPTQSAGTVDLSLGASTVPSNMPDPSGKVGELQVIDADGYVLAIRPVMMEISSPGPCS